MARGRPAVHGFSGASRALPVPAASVHTPPPGLPPAQGLPLASTLQLSVCFPRHLSASQLPQGARCPGMGYRVTVRRAQALGQPLWGPVSPSPSPRAGSREHPGSAMRPSVTPRPLPLRVEAGFEPMSVQICFLGYRERRPWSWGPGKESAPAFHRQMKTRLYLPCFWLFSPGQQSAAPRCSRGGGEPCVTVEGAGVLGKSTEAGPSPHTGLLIWE